MLEGGWVPLTYKNCEYIIMSLFSTLTPPPGGRGRVPKSRHNDLEYPGGRYPNITKKAEYPWGTRTYFYVKMKWKNVIKDVFFMEN